MKLSPSSVDNDTEMDVKRNPTFTIQNSINVGENFRARRTRRKKVKNLGYVHNDRNCGKK